MKKRILFALFIISVFLVWGCYPEGPDYIEEMDVVITYHNDTYDFVGKATYAMPDRLLRLPETCRKVRILHSSRM